MRRQRRRGIPSFPQDGKIKHCKDRERTWWWTSVGTAWMICLILCFSLNHIFIKSQQSTGSSLLSAGKDMKSRGYTTCLFLFHNQRKKKNMIHKCAAASLQTCDVGFIRQKWTSSVFVCLGFSAVWRWSDTSVWTKPSSQLFMFHRTKHNNRVSGCFSVPLSGWSQSLRPRPQG